ncbi:folylpolyglutamate synthase, mitochondrial-like [Anopheles ziemanni]|uniref:folylpolyglutamate synthase, mitochondrial-like n=1 Tax=Anopheles coustani TaxID=139045 RepID=UPI002658D2E8|nr:folylpolyglutamate synthase, mitochondrial-like [Anopheles coustani]XP_058176733.1 folylpolyglutamate synthase, mitochondrial-like [Anopheles ziemanni]
MSNHFVPSFHMLRLAFNLISRRVMMIEPSVSRCCETAVLQVNKKQLHSTCPDSSELVVKEQNYENAIRTLNTLQSNFSVLQDSIKRKHQDDSKHVSDTIKFLERIGIPLSKLDRLPVIHVSGSKGKGSTCAMVESILRSHGYRTGFFSSPHLVSVTERIRLNGVPVANERFSEHFWNIYNRLEAARDRIEDLPSYFCFLTIMAIDIFLRENVDVCVIEVGIGGRFDSTNVLRNTQTVGITSLGLEHTMLLGETLEEIAWQKAGIIKTGSDVFTTSQPAKCLEVIHQECLKKEARIYIAPSRLNEYDWVTKPLLMKEACAAVELNTSLAIQIASNWIRRTRPNLLPTNGSTVLPSIVEGIDHCFWPGRLQIVPYNDRRTLYLDGAHTVESITVCARWFASKSRSHHKKLLVFNTTGERDSHKLLSILSRTVKFDAAFFTPNVAFCAVTRADTVNHNFPLEQQLHRCEQNCALWQTQLFNRNGFVHDSVESVFQNIDKMIPSASHSCDILISGSIHLLGATLSALKIEHYAYSATCSKDSNSSPT